MTKTVTVQAQQRWEYCLETRRTETSLMNMLNELGQQGWELVNVLYYKDIKGIMSWTGFLKRPAASHAARPGDESTISLKSAPPGQLVEKPPSPDGFDLAGDEFQLKKETEQSPKS
jgi:hypothetical protein